MRKISLFLAMLIVLFSGQNVQAKNSVVDVEVIQGSMSMTWGRIIDGDDLESPNTAGSKLDSAQNYESNAIGEAFYLRLAISRAGSWTLQVAHQGASELPAGVSYKVQRINDDRHITGGFLSPVTVGANPVTFFSGSGNRKNIDVKIILTGVTLTANPGTYSQNFAFTIAPKKNLCIQTGK